MNRFLALSLCSAALALPSLASAQASQYPVTTSPSTYVPLPIPGGATPTTLPLTGGSAPNDRNQSITLPFSFTFFGSTKTTALVDENGWLGFGSRPNDPWNPRWGTGAPTDLIAAWWDDLLCQNNVQTQVVGTAPNRQFVIQWHCAYFTNSSASFQAQIWLTEGSPVIEVKYGTIQPSSAPWEVGFGIKNANGTTSIQGPSRRTGTGCGILCTEQDFPQNTTIRYGFTVQPDLRAEPTLGAMTTVGSNLEFPVNVLIRNLGQTDATGVGFDVYLSTDDVLDPAVDTLIASHPTVETVRGTLTATFTEQVNIPRPPPGQYWVCAFVDPTNAVVEANDGNNTACTPTPFLVGADLKGTISVPAFSAHGEMVPYTVNIQNVGSDATGTFSYEIYLSGDQNFGSDDLMYTGQLSLQGTDSFSGIVQAPIPSTLRGQRFYALLRLDSTNAVQEANEQNNVAASATQLELRQPDLYAKRETASYIRIDPDGCFFGDEITVSYEICNAGVVPARGFVTSVVFADTATPQAPNPPFGDPELDAIPLACMTDADCGNNGRAGFCRLGFCHDSCSSDADCETGLACEPDREIPAIGKSCQNLLNANQCKRFESTIVVPSVNENNGEIYEEGRYFLGLVPDSIDALGEVSEQNAEIVQPALQCRLPRPNLLPASVIPPARVAAGEAAAVFRIIKNSGKLDADARYRYVLSTNEFPSANDVQLTVQATGGDGRVQVARGSESRATDLVRIPSRVVPGDYYLGLLVDPANQVQELDEGDNTFVTSARIRVEEPALRILTTSLPDANRGALYQMQLVAVGGAGAYEWSVKPSDLPAGLTLSTDGMLSGTPTVEGTRAFTVTVTSGGVSSDTMLALRVLPPMGALTVTTSSLPPAVLAQPYTVRLAASGGLPPYKNWDMRPRIPGLTIDAATGVISGSPSRVSPAGGDTFTVSVEDDRGNKASRELTLSIVERADVFITTTNLREQTAGKQIPGDEGCVEASGGSGSYVWTFDEKTLPEGVTSETRGAKGCLVGTPLECKTFTVGVRVEDASSHVSDSAEIPLPVVCSRVNLLTERLDDVKPGDTVSVQLEADAGENPSFRVYAGRLPAGLALGTSGLLEGTVAADAAPGTYNFVVEITDDEGGYGLEALAIRVVPVPKELPPVKAKDGGGCSTAGDGASGFVPFAIALIGLVAAGFRRRAAAFARVASFATVAAVAGGAQAQSSAYSLTGPYDLPYAELQNATAAPASLNNIDWGNTTTQQWVVALPSDFSFRYFGRTFGWLSIGGNGGIIPLTSASPGTGSDFYVDITNDDLPDSAGPAGIIAPWWDDMARGATSPHAGGLSYVIEGSYPHRVIKVQWKNLAHYECTSTSTSSVSRCADTRSYSFQAWIYESAGTLDSTIVFSYATPIGPTGTPWGGLESAYTGSSTSSRPSATVGIESPAEDIGIKGLSCTPSCTFGANFPAEQVIVFSKKADLAAMAVRGEAIGWAGVSMPVEVEVKNLGAVTASGFAVRFYGSTDGRLDARDIDLGTTTVTKSAAPGASVLFKQDVTLPADIAAGSYYVLAKVDPIGVVDEDVTVNNVGAYGPFVVGEAMPDVVVETVNAPTGADVGAMFTFDWAVRNRGNLRAADVAYAVVLSDNDIISASDRRIATGRFSVDALTVAPLSVDVVLPADVLPGRYYLGIVLDPDNVLPEISDLNNVGASNTWFDALGGQLQLVTSVLPPAQAGATYCAELVAAGGNGAYDWSVVSGSQLPAGLELVRQSARSTLLCGAPTQVGTWAFSLQVESGGELAVGSLSLEVSRSAMPLSIASAEVPTAAFNEPYVANLVAVGGQAPYAWSLLSGKLPTGLALTQDGSVRGTPVADGTASVTVKVVDAQENVATQQLTIIVSAPPRLTCVTRTLPTVNVGESFRADIVAAGGTRPYTFTNVETRRLASGLADSGEQKSGVAPEGLRLGSEGQVTGTPTKAGTYLWLVKVEDAARGNDQCFVRLDVTYEQGLTVTSRSLADATVGVPYRAQLQVAGGDRVTWKLVSGSELPFGLDMTPEGLISGTLNSDVLLGEDSRTFSFVVEARDAQNRVGVAGLSIKLVEPQAAPPAPNADDGGCQAAGAAPGLLGVVFALGLVSLRRRR